MMNTIIEQANTHATMTSKHTSCANKAVPKRSSSQTPAPEPAETWSTKCENSNTIQLHQRSNTGRKFMENWIICFIKICLTKTSNRSLSISVLLSHPVLFSKPWHALSCFPGCTQWQTFTNHSNDFFGTLWSSSRKPCTFLSLPFLAQWDQKICLPTSPDSWLSRIMSVFCHACQVSVEGCWRRV